MRTHALYGDDDQEKIEQIFNKKNEIQRMVDVSNRQLMKERLKNGTKKKSIDTSSNAKKVKFAPQDDIVEKRVEDRFNEKRVEKLEQKDETKKTEVKEKVKKEKKKRNNTKVAGNIIIIIILLVVGLVIFQFKDEIYTKIKSFIPDNVSSPIITEDSGVEERLRTALKASISANDSLKTEFKNLTDAVETTDTSVMTSSISSLQTSVSEAKETLKSHQQDFAAYEGGESYYNSIVDRFTNLENVLSQVSTSSDNAVIRELVNQAVSYENTLIETDKQLLIQFLKQNNIEYTENENGVSFDI